MRGLMAGLAVTAATLMVSGCGMSDDGGPDSAAYAALAQQIGSSASAYATAANATVDPASCHSAHGSYDARVRPMVERMRSMSGAMDQRMASMGYGALADMGCGADALGAELDQHDPLACTSTAMSANHAEASRHGSAMGAWADHQHARADQMGGMQGMGGGMMGGGVMMHGGGMMDPGSATSTCHRNGDGTFRLEP